jgi:outer membrane lipopolysaccharide assembly protein LptE/RlpB
LKVVLALILVLGLVSCGYKPSSKFSRDIMGEKISTSVRISAQDPENTVIIKDAVDEAIIEVFHASLVDRANSQTHLNLSISNPSYSPIVYDSDGFVIGYRMNVSLNIARYHDGVTKSYSVKGTHDFTVAPNAIVTDQQRFDAIRFSAAKAIRSFVAKVSAEGARAKKSK